MAWHLFAWRWLMQASAGSLIVLLVGSLAAQACRQPVQRVRLIILALFSSLMVPWLGALPVTPRWSARWLAPPTLNLSATTATAAHTSVLPVVFTQASGQPPLLRPGQDALLLKHEAPDHASTLHPTKRTFPKVWLPQSLAFLPWQLVVLGIYSVISLGFIAWWFVGQYRLWQINRSARPVPESIRKRFLEVSGQQGVNVALMMSDRITLPFTFTWKRPVILLPVDFCLSEDSSALQYALAHEWSHVERRDSWAWNLASVAGFVMFYQPLFWWLRRQLRLCQDFLADDQAASRGSAEDYAAYLVRLARECGAISTLPALGIGDRRSNLYRRVVMLVQNQEPLQRHCPAGWSLTTACVTVLTLLVAAGLRLDAATADAPDTQGDKKVASSAPKTPAVEGETLHYAGKVKNKDTGKPIEGVLVTVRRAVFNANGGRPTLQETKHTTDANGSYSFTIPPEQVAEKRLYIELDVEHPDYATQANFGYSLGMILKNEKLGERPFFENVEMRPAEAVTGRVETPEGKPAEGVDLLAYSRSSKPKVGENFEYGSFAKAKTDKNGSFRLPITTPGIGVFWILPKHHAPEMHEIKADKRGDYGTFVVKNGITVSGQALDDQGKPLAGLFIEIGRDRGSSPDTEILGQLIVSDALERRTETDSEGRFTFDPLPPGTFIARPVDYQHVDGKGLVRRSLPGVFSPLKVILKEGNTPEPLEIRAAPFVMIEGGWVDSKGKPRSGWALMISGRFDGQFWHTQGLVASDGKFSVKVPHGLEQANIQLIINEHASIRHRVGKTGELSTSRDLRFDTLDHDIKDLEIIRYDAPIVISKVTTKDGQPIGDVIMTGDFLEENNGPGMRMSLKDGLQSDVHFNKQEDGRYRTTQLTPDREVKITAHAKNFKPESKAFKLAEGKTEEVTFVLEPE